MQLYVELRSLAQCCLDVADACHLASYVEVDETQTILDVILLEYLKRLEQFARREAELACVATALLPASTTLAGEFDAYTDIGAHTHALAYLRYSFQLVEFLHHKEYAAAHLLCKKSQFNVAVILVAVAYDERVAVGVHCYDGMQLGL